MKGSEIIFLNMDINGLLFLLIEYVKLNFKFKKIFCL